MPSGELNFFEGVECEYDIRNSCLSLPEVLAGALWVYSKKIIGISVLI